MTPPNTIASDTLVEAIARAIAEGQGDDFDHAHRDKPHWIETRGESGGRYRDINEPRQPDYIDAARAALTAITAAGYAVVPIDAVHALEASHIALDDWLHTYAPDECGEEYVQTTRGRIFEAGGTLAYIADLQQENRRILNMIRATNNGKAE